MIDFIDRTQAAKVANMFCRLLRFLKMIRVCRKQLYAGKSGVTTKFRVETKVGVTTSGAVTQPLWKAGGFVLLDSILATALASVLAGLSFGAFQHYEALARETLQRTTVSALKTASRLHRAKRIVAADSEQIPLALTEKGIPKSTGGALAASLADCSALWEGLLEQPFAANLENPDDFAAIATPEWKPVAAGKWCEFHYEHPRLPTLVVRYHIQTGEVTTH